MASPSIGRIGQLRYSTNGVGTYTLVGGVIDGTFNIDVTLADVSDHDSGLWKEFIYDRGSGTLDVSLNYEEGDSSQDALLSAAAVQTTLYYEWQPKGALTGQATYKAQGLITKATLSGPNVAQSKIQMTIQLTGTVTKGVQP